MYSHSETTVAGEYSQSDVDRRRPEISSDPTVDSSQGAPTSAAVVLSGATFALEPACSTPRRRGKQPTACSELVSRRYSEDEHGSDRLPRKGNKLGEKE